MRRFERKGAEEDGWMDGRQGGPGVNHRVKNNLNRCCCNWFTSKELSFVFREIGLTFQPWLSKFQWI